MTPVALTIAGSDSGGGAGIQADLRTFSACGAYGASAVTCLTAQNPDSVTSVSPVTPDFLLEQLLQVDRFFQIAAAKTGMLFSEELIRAVARFLRQRPHLRVVVDPVMVSTSGAILLQPAAVQALQDELLPLAALVTPNLDEAAVMLGEKPATGAEMAEAALALLRRFRRPVLLKGGHLEGNTLIDILALRDEEVVEFRDPRIENVDTHGSGCTLSAAIAAHLAQGRELREAVATSRTYLRRAMNAAVVLRGRRFINHSA